MGEDQSFGSEINGINKCGMRSPIVRNECRI